jgi:hypothetical protein
MYEALWKIVSQSSTGRPVVEGERSSILLVRARRVLRRGVKKSKVTRRRKPHKKSRDSELDSLRTLFSQIWADKRRESLAAPWKWKQFYYCTAVASISPSTA